MCADARQQPSTTFTKIVQVSGDAVGPCLQWPLQPKAGIHCCEVSPTTFRNTGCGVTMKATMRHTGIQSESPLAIARVPRASGGKAGGIAEIFRPETTVIGSSQNALWRERPRLYLQASDSPRFAARRGAAQHQPQSRKHGIDSFDNQTALDRPYVSITRKFIARIDTNLRRWKHVISDDSTGV
jgi:hypothetical protein